MSLGVGTFAASGNTSMIDPSFTYGGQAANSGSGTSFSFNLNNLGDDYPSRYVVFAVRWARAGTINPPSSVSATLGGAPATLISAAPSASFTQALFIALRPTGTSATAVITLGVTVTTCIAAWAILKDLESATPTQHDRASGTNTTQVNVAIPDKGIVFAYWAAGYGVSPNATNWSTPMVVAMNQNVLTQSRHSLAYRVASSGAVASYSVVNTFNYSSTQLSVAVFR